MATSTVAAITKMVHFLMAFAFLLQAAVANPAVITAAAVLPDYFQNYMMTLSLDPEEAGPVPFEYTIVPLTQPAGLNITNLNTLNAIKTQGTLVRVDQTNYNLTIDSDIVVYMSCDPNDATSNISPSDVFNTLTGMAKKPKAIVLYSVTAAYCALGGNDLAYSSTWSIISREDAWGAVNLSQPATGTIMANIAANSTFDANLNGGDGGGNNSAVAMSILYSITGLITLLFLIIIATGAVRAHRHPERYGPRAGLGGRPRQSRARGLAKAVLETLPIVKFGDPHPVKVDPENELESMSGDRREDSTVPVQTTPTNEAAARQIHPTAEAARDGQKAATGANSGAQSTKSEERVDDEHLGCSICTEDFTVGEDVRVLPCDHKFHPSCIDPWLVNVSGTCPLCRLDLRPVGSGEEETTENLGRQTPEPLIPPERESPDELNNSEVAQSRRISRLLDWNRLRHASVDERIHALRQIREQQDIGVPVSDDPAAEANQRAGLTDRLRDKFHIRTRTQS